MYKILAKAISICVRTILPIVIHPTQTRFIRERSILDNVYAFCEYATLVAKSKQKLAIVMLDFEKVYDHVDWDFLQGALAQFGFLSKVVVDPCEEEKHKEEGPSWVQGSVDRLKAEKEEIH
mgnify:CR=1 FL=1